MNYKDWLKDWLENYVRTTSKNKTFLCYSEIANNHIVPALGEYELADLTTLSLQKFIAHLLTNGNLRTGNGLSSNAVNAVITVLRSSLSVAEDLGMIEYNPANKLKRPKAAEKPVECFSVSEQKRIEQAILTDKRSYMFGVILCLYTGLRIGELLALKWEDIDFKNGTLSIERTCYDGIVDGKFGRIENSPKTNSSQRVIPLPKQIIQLLKSVRKTDLSEYVIVKGAEPILLRTYQRNFSAVLERLHIRHRGFHALRHTFATRAIECGMDVKTLSEILGHKNATVTLNRYAHSLMEHKREMMNRLGKFCDLSQNK